MFIAAYFDLLAFEFAHHHLLEFGFTTYDLMENKIETEHIIISDNLHLKNGRYVPNNRERFNFGESRLMSLTDTKKYAQKILSAPGSCLIGHNIGADLDFLNVSFGYQVSLPVYDTQTMFQELVLDQSLVGLSRMLNHLEIPYMYLHNAGNDAYYTLLAFLKLTKIQ